MIYVKQICMVYVVKKRIIKLADFGYFTWMPVAKLSMMLSSTVDMRPKSRNTNRPSSPGVMKRMVGLVKEQFESAWLGVTIRRGSF